MSATEHLSRFGVTIEQVRSSILDNLTSPREILSTAQSYDLSHSLLADIVGAGVTAEDVRGFFADRGIDSSILDSLGDSISDSLRSFLDNYGLNLTQAREYILNSLNDPAGLYQTIQQVGLGYDLLAEIYGGITAQQVESFFAPFAEGGGTGGNGGGTGGAGGGIQLVSDNVSGLLSIVGPNTGTGNLSTESLRSQVIAVTGEEAYNQAFDVGAYEGAGDGVFTPTELGFGDLGELPATQGTLESLFYGSIINSLRAIDAQEIQELNSFITSNQENLSFGSGDTYNQFVQLMIDMYKDPAQPSIYPDSVIETVAVTTGQIFVQTAGGEDISALEGIFLAGL